MKTLRLIIFLVLAASSLAFAEGTTQTVLVLPFENNSKAPGLEWISEAFPEVLTERMASAGFYLVTRDDRNAAFDRMGIPSTTKLSRETLYVVSEQMDADYVILGSYNYDGQNFSATAQLLDMKKLRLSPEMKESGPLVNMVDIQRALSWDLLKNLDAATISKQAFLQSSPPIRLDAFENYVRGVLSTSRQEKLQRFHQAIRLNPEYTQAMMQLGKTYYNNREYESAESWFMKIPRTDPLADEANFFLGLSAYYIGDYDHAEDAFHFIETQLPLPEVNNNLGVVLGRRGKQDELEYLKKSVAADANDVDYHFNLAIAYARIFDTANAKTQLAEVLRLRPSDAEAKSFMDTLNGTNTQLGATLRTASTNQAKLPLPRVKLNYDETSYRQLQLEIERTAEERLATVPPKQHAEFHVQRGQELLSKGFVADARDSFQEAVVLDPENVSAHTGLAQADEALGRNKEATTEANLSLRLQPSAGAFLVLARQNLRDNKVSAASEQVERALGLEPANQEAQTLKRQIAEKLAVGN